MFGENQTAKKRKMGITLSNVNILKKNKIHGNLTPAADAINMVKTRKSGLTEKIRGFFLFTSEL